MKIPYVKATFDEAAYNLENKIKTTIGQKQSNYVIDRLFAANNQISDIYTDTKASKILHKVETKAITDWGSMHKIQDFLLKNAGKVSKGAIYGGIAAAALVAATTIAKIAGAGKSKD